jgi:2,3-diketo-5-methylthio-1-phosphopentane phosphatase
MLYATTYSPPFVQTDNIGYGSEKRKQGNRDTLANTITFRDSFHEMMDSISTPYPKCIQYLVDNIQLDPYFKQFLIYAREQNIPVVVLSSGMAPIIEALLLKLVGEDLAKDIAIVANGVQARPGKTLEDENGWEITFHDESGFGHDKSREIRPYAALPEGKRPTMFYAGDGVSDLSAARETDLLFAKKGRDLVTYCVNEDVPFTVFEDWESITQNVREIVYVVLFSVRFVALLLTWLD